MMGQPVGPRVELPIAQSLVLMHHRRRLRRLLHLRLEQLMDAPLRRIRRCRPVQFLQQIVALRRRQDVDALHRLPHVRNHRPQQRQQITTLPLDRRLIKKCRGIVQCSSDLLAMLAKAQLQIELDLIEPVGSLHTQPGKVERRTCVVLPSQHHLEQWRVVKRPGRPHDLHHLLERQVLMLLRSQRRAPRPLQKRRHVRPARQVHPERQGVDEEADQLFDLPATPIGTRHPDHKVVLPRQPGQHRSPCRQHRHEQRRAMLPAPPLQVPRQIHIDDNRNTGSGKRLLGWPRTVRRQREHGRRA
ncbi:hypothetical protein LMG24235_08704 [Paraburkholderia sabiae]|nr:hypothetical protein LMG24235_08704 [Paraburkholderia sabiae]